MHFEGMSPRSACAIQMNKALAEFWNRIRVCEDPGGTSWDVLEPIEQEVTELLWRGTVEDIRRASRLTAKAEYLWRGGRLGD